MKYAACGIKEVRARRWWPAYELGAYRWIWLARFRCWLHRKAFWWGFNSCGETWIEERPQQPPQAPDTPTGEKK